jgi:hypothetical protein
MSTTKDTPEEQRRSEKHDKAQGRAAAMRPASRPEQAHPLPDLRENAREAEPGAEKG